MKTLTCLILIFFANVSLESKAASRVELIAKLQSDVEELRQEADELIKDNDNNQGLQGDVRDTPPDETKIDQETGSEEEIDLEDASPPDETTIDQKTGSEEEIDDVLDATKNYGLTEVEINERNGYTEDEAKVVDENGKRSASADVRLWPRVNGKLHVPYEISYSFSSEDRQKIQQYIGIMNNNIQCNDNTWKPRTSSDSHYVRFVKETGCWSFVGRVPYFGTGYQKLSLGTGCVTKGVTMHEMLHAMGFYHEQSRPDRDQYVDIIYANIRSGTSNNNFDKKSSMHEGSQSTKYDYGSLMHYSRTAFSINGRATIIPKPDPSVPIGQRFGMSPTDILELNNVYDCKNGGTTSSTQAPVTTKSPTKAPSPTKSPTKATSSTKSPTKAPSSTKSPTKAPSTTKSPTKAPLTTKPPTKAPTTPSRVQIYKCGFGLSSCDKNNNNIFIYRNSRIKKFSLSTCTDSKKYCPTLKRFGLCTNALFKTPMRATCRKSCGVCTTSTAGYYYQSTARGSGVIAPIVKYNLLRSKGICKVLNSKQKFCVSIDYQRTSSTKSPNIYISSISRAYVNWRTTYKRNFVNGRSSIHNPLSGTRGTLNVSVDLTCTNKDSYVYLSVYRQRYANEYTRINGVTMATGSC